MTEDATVVLERTVTQLSVLYSLCQNLAGRTSVDDACGAALDRLGDVVPFDLGVILSHDAGSVRWTVRASKGVTTAVRELGDGGRWLEEALQSRGERLLVDVPTGALAPLGIGCDVAWLWALPVAIDARAGCAILLAGLRRFEPSRAHKWLLRAFAAHFSSVLRGCLGYLELEDKARALKQANEYLSSVMGGMTESLVVLDGERTIRLVNSVAARLLGHDADELVGRPAAAFFEDGCLNAARWQALLDGERIGALHTTLRTREGVDVPVSLSAAAMRDGAGAVLGVVCVAHDLREMLKLQNTALQSMKMAAIGQLAAGVAHEINNPLGVILGFAQALEESVQRDDPMALPVRSIAREARRCKGLVQSLLTFSRRSGRPAQPLDLNATIQVALQLVQAQSKIREVEVRTVLAPDLPAVLGDAGQLQQVIVNLANNALDATAARPGGRLTVRTARADGEWVVIEVEDTGVGIPPHLTSRIFDPFFTSKDVGKGTGLGLTLVYEIVQHHEGRIEVDSTEGVGTRMSVFLPARAAAEP
jgi:PAS domain S-box-containing protein